MEDSDRYYHCESAPRYISQYDFRRRPIVAFRIFTEFASPFQRLGFAITHTSFQAIEWDSLPHYDWDRPMLSLRVADWEDAHYQWGNYASCIIDASLSLL